MVDYIVEFINGRWEYFDASSFGMAEKMAIKYFKKEQLPGYHREDVIISISRRYL